MERNNPFVLSVKTAPNAELDVEEVFRVVDEHRFRLNPADFTERLERTAFFPSLPDQVATTGERRGLRVDYEKVDDSGKQDWLAGTTDFWLMDNAWRQLCERVGRAPYFRKNVETFPDALQFQVMNWAIQQKSKELQLNDRLLTFRTFRPDNERYLRGILTQDFTPIDDFELIGFLRQAPELREARVREFSVEPRKSFFRFLFPATEVQFKPYPNRDDSIVRQVILGNSEVGCSSVSLQGATVHSSCGNVCTSKRMMATLRLVHRGDKSHRIRLLRIGIREALLKSDKLVDAWRQALSIGIEKPFEEFQRLGKTFNWSKGMTERVEHSFNTESRANNAYEMAQAITRTARDLHGEQRFELEENAGDFLMWASTLARTR